MIRASFPFWSLKQSVSICLNCFCPRLKLQKMSSLLVPEEILNNSVRDHQHGRCDVTCKSAMQVVWIWAMPYSYFFFSGQNLTTPNIVGPIMLGFVASVCTWQKVWPLPKLTTRPVNFQAEKTVKAVVKAGKNSNSNSDHLIYILTRQWFLLFSLYINERSRPEFCSCPTNWLNESPTILTSLHFALKMINAYCIVSRCS